MASSATVFIQVWVDINAIQNGSTKGVYAVDNRVGQGSTGEGSTALTTHVTNGSTIQWNVYNIDPTSTVVPAITAIGNAAVFGAGGQPQNDGTGACVGQVQQTGQSSYQITFNVQKQPGSAGITVNFSPSLSVQ